MAGMIILWIRQIIFFQLFYVSELHLKDFIGIFTGGSKITNDANKVTILLLLWIAREVVKYKCYRYMGKDIKILGSTKPH